MTAGVPTFEEEISPGRVVTMAADGTGLSVVDPWLKPHDDALRERYETKNYAGINRALTKQ